MTRDQRIVSDVRRVMGDAVAELSDRQVRWAYSCWHIYGGGNWHNFRYYLTLTSRQQAYSQKLRHA